MTIFRTKHERNYTCVNNFICTDKRLSCKAKGIWLYAFSRPDDWTFHLNDIINQCADGRDSIRAGIKELEDFGYLVESKLEKTGNFLKAITFFMKLLRISKKVYRKRKIRSR